MKTLRAYKLFRRINGRLYPLFIGRGNAVPVGAWVQAECIPTKGYAMIARLHNNGCDVRVDIGNTGRNWPDCDDQYQPGFPWLSYGDRTWKAAEEWARANGATEIIRTGSHSDAFPDDRRTT